jgi:hypothetical protein
MKFKVMYLQPKKKVGYYSKQEAIFYDERDALNWEHYVRQKNCQDIQIVPVFSK